jgi:hypothetical protein
MKEIIFLNSINYDIGSFFKISSQFFQRFIYITFSNPTLIFVFIFVIFLAVYLAYAKRKVGNIGGWKIGLVLYFVLFSLFFGFWWLVSIFNLLLKKKVKWR